MSKEERRAKEWLRTEHSEGNIQSLVNLIKEFIEPKEKEIAELEDKNKALEQYADLADAKVDEVKSKLSKAKEIIGEYMNWADWKGSNCPSYASICIKAEQFLKENK